MRFWDRRPLPRGLKDRLHREFAKIEFYNEQIRCLEKERRELLRTASDRATEQARRIYHLRGIGENGAWLLAMEFFSWRDFHNRRELAALAGLVPSLYASGERERNAGITKAGNRHVRAIIVELAWCWVRYQPQSELTLWYQRRFGGGSRRVRKIGIVALARRLLIELWRYLEMGTLPVGAELST